MNRMALLLYTRKGFGVDGRAGLLASRVRTCSVSDYGNRPSQSPSGRSLFSSLTVARQRGILTRFPPRQR